MAERTFIPSSPACGQWETFLADALDGLLRPEDEATFTAHMAVCPACTALYEEARQGPRMAGVSFARAGGAGRAARQDSGARRVRDRRRATALATGGRQCVSDARPAWQRPGFMGHVRRFAEPRLMMTAAMAFFSIALTLNLTGVRLSSCAWPTCGPARCARFMERRLTMASTPIIRYYDHLRLVYEVQSTDARTAPDTKAKARAREQQASSRIRSMLPGRVQTGSSGTQGRRLTRGPSASSPVSTGNRADSQ